jgi:Asp-tRNA(Asn)/Glu-tRNA(Gln) amidotransferase A subunit family amidase
MHVSARLFLKYGLGVSVGEYLAARRRRFEYVKDLDELLGEDTVILSPTVAASGFLADGRLTPQDEPGMLPGEVFNTEIANLTGHPAISLPAGISPNGVPFGLQVMAPRFRDGMLLELAATWEERHGWPRSAPSYDSFEQALGLTL